MYWDGTSFDTDMEGAAALVTGFGAQVSVVWNDYVQAWCMLDSGFFSTKLTVRTARSVTGPWSQPVQVRGRALVRGRVATVAAAWVDRGLPAC